MEFVIGLFLGLMIGALPCLHLARKEALYGEYLERRLGIRSISIRQVLRESYRH